MSSKVWPRLNNDNDPNYYFNYWLLILNNNIKTTHQNYGDRTKLASAVESGLAHPNAQKYHSRPWTHSQHFLPRILWKFIQTKLTHAQHRSTLYCKGKYLLSLWNASQYRKSSGHYYWAAVSIYNSSRSKQNIGNRWDHHCDQPLSNHVFEIEGMYWRV